MECKEATDFLTPAVDGELAVSLREELFAHLKNCPPCRSAFELEQMTKRVVGRHLPRVPAPPGLTERIRANIQTAPTATRTSNTWRFGGLFQPIWKPIAAAAVLTSAILFFNSTPSRSHHSHASPNDRDVFHQVFNNFDGILDGNLKPDVESEDPGVVQAFFFPKINFNASVRKLDDCKLIGGMFSKYRDQNLAHVVYEHHGEVIYVFQANLSCIMEGRTLSLPEEVQIAMQSTGHFEKEYSPDCSIIAWAKDSTFYCAVADIPKNDLLTCVSSIRE